MTTYEPFTVAVSGGQMAGGVWNRDDSATAPSVLAIHGITASHREWPLVAERLDGFQVIAPDLRGRGRSNALPPPWSMVNHADDMVAVLDHFGVEAVTVVGHSMGGFVAGWFAARYPERLHALVLVDGGLPLSFTAPEDVAPDDLAAYLLGPAGKRLTQVYGSREDYVAFWRSHPAFGSSWNDAVQEYVDYDLEPVSGGFRPAARLDAVSTNIVEQDGTGGYREALSTVEGPVDFLHAPRGLLDEVPPLYPADLEDRFGELVSGLEIHHVPDVNHYGIVLTPSGATQVAEVVRSAAARHPMPERGGAVS